MLLNLFKFELFNKMGVSYSQPPRGFQYSVIQKTDSATKKCRVDPDLAESAHFSSFQDLFHNNWEHEKHLPYFCEIGPNGNVLYHTYEECDQKIQNIKTQLLSFTRSNPLGIYANNNFHSLLIYDSALLNQIPVLASSPQFQKPEDFIKSASEMNCGAIYCEKENQKDLQNLTKIPIFSDPFHIPSFIPSERKIPTKINEQPNEGKIEEKQENQEEFNNNDHDEEEDDRIEYEYDVVFADNIQNKCRSSQLIGGLESWATRLKICRDARVIIDFPIGHNLNRLVRFVCILHRALICLPSSIDQIKQFNATHLFATQESFHSIIEKEMNKKRDKGFLYNFKYYPYYALKNVKMSLGGTSQKADKNVFNNFKEDFGKEIRFCFTDKLLNPYYHNFFTVTNTLPLSVLFVPEEWINYGTCLPADPRFTKYGTVGGPVGCSITIQGQYLECSNSRKVLNLPSKWDEVCSLVILQEKKQ